MKSTGKSASATALASAAAKLQACKTRERGQRLPTLFLLTDDERLPDPAAAVRKLPRGGSSCRLRARAAVIARARNPHELEILVRAIAPICRRRGVALIVANDARLAHRYGADGVHLSEERSRGGNLASLALPRRGSRGRQRLLLTGAAHSFPALLRAVRIGADAVLLSPAFATESHPDARPLGIIRFAAIVRAARRMKIRTPLIALGGVTAGQAQRLTQAGANGLAAIGALAG
jgi:thiamine-phosphate pyrophosphorylase